MRTALHIFATGWKEKKIEGGIEVAVTCRSLNRNEMQTTGVRKSADVKQLFEERRRTTRTRVAILSKNRKPIFVIGATGQQGLRVG